MYRWVVKEPRQVGCQFSSDAYFKFTCKYTPDPTRHLDSPGASLTPHFPQQMWNLCNYNVGTALFEFDRHQVLIISYRIFGTTYRFHLLGQEYWPFFWIIVPWSWDRYVIPKQRQEIATIRYVISRYITACLVSDTNRGFKKFPEFAGIIYWNCYCE